MDSLLKNDFLLLFRYLLAGLIVGESFFLSKTLAARVSVHEIFKVHFVLCFLFLVLFIFSIIFIVIRRGLVSGVVKFYRGKNYRLAILFFCGLITSCLLGGMFSEQYNKLSLSFSSDWVLVLFGFPWVVLLFQSFGGTSSNYSESRDPYFLIDEAIVNEEEDRLDMVERAKVFSGQVLNGGSKSSFIFGLDAPWGTGKTSFLGICQGFWEKSGSCIVYKFEPIRFHDEDDFEVKLIEGLINKIEERVSIPRAKPLFYEYLRSVKPKAEYSLFGMKFEFSNLGNGASDALELLSEELINLDLRMIVVIEDLDRISWSAVKRVLYSLRRSLALPNISYVLCYDTKNLSSLAEDMEAAEVQEFLEKFINVSSSIFVHPNRIYELAESGFQDAVKRNQQIAPELMAQLKLLMARVGNIYLSKEYYLYERYLGDLRKIKKIINTFFSMSLERIDCRQLDFDSSDLLDLVLIYVWHPRVFRRIFNSETGGRKGFFSVSRDFSGSNNSYKNSTEFEEYISNDGGEARFLLGRLFKVSSSGISFSEEDRRCKAFFNERNISPFGNQTVGNLERYINLIAFQVAPSHEDSYKHFNSFCVDFYSGRQLPDIFNSNTFSLINGAAPRVELIRHIVVSDQIYSSPEKDRLIDFLLSDGPQQPLLGGGFSYSPRESYLAFLSFTLAKYVSSGVVGQDNLVHVSNRVFGEGDYEGRGVLEILLSPGRGVLGFFDALLFRLNCSIERNNEGDVLWRALLQHADSTAQSSGFVREIAMKQLREVSQFIFERFFERFISTRLNIFKAVYEVRNEVIIGGYGECFSDSSADVKNRIEICKGKVLQFVLYQLSSKASDGGVGCGIYDVKGSEFNENINFEMNKYLFLYCFSPAVDEENADIFMRFVGGFLSRDMSAAIRSPGEYIFSVDTDGILSVFNEKALALYWRRFGGLIKSRNYHLSSKVVVTANYSLPYSAIAPLLYDFFDGLDQ